MAPDDRTIPDDMSVQEAGEFWDTHSVADFASELVEIEYNPDTKMVLIPIDRNLIPEVERHARQRHISIEELINAWVQEKIAN